jgi:proteasome lid subunit RPN8/RPN11
MCKEVEVMWFIYGFWLNGTFYGYKKFYQRGNEGSVEFDWKSGNNFFVLGWVHTHPSTFGCDPSSTDDKTMRSWVRGKNKPLICAIACNGDEVWYLYHRGRDRKIFRTVLEVKTVLNFVKGYRKGSPELV